MAWSVALDAYGVNEDLTDSEYEDDSDDYESDDSDYDSDDSESESDDDSSQEEEELRKMQLIKQKLAAKHARKVPVCHDEQKLCWKTRNVTTHEWTLPANKILPVNLQSLFREAAQNPEVDIQQRLQEALAGEAGGPLSFGK